MGLANMETSAELNFVDMRMDGVDFSWIRPEETFVYAGLAGPISLCYVVRRGVVWLEFEKSGVATLRLQEGSVVGLSGLIPHWLKSSPALSTKAAASIPLTALRPGVREGGEVSILIGHAPSATLAESSLISGVSHLTRESGKLWLRIWRAVEAIEDELLDPQPSPGRDAAVRRYAELMLLNIVRWLTQNSEPRELAALAALGDHRLMRALAAATNEVDRPWTVEQMASVAGMSRATFARHFHAVTGSTPSHTLALIRLRRAAELMIHSDLTVDGAAETAGYRSAAAFIRAFQRAYGQTPSRWRKLHM